MWKELTLVSGLPNKAKKITPKHKIYWHKNSLYVQINTSWFEIKIDDNSSMVKKIISSDNSTAIIFSDYYDGFYIIINKLTKEFREVFFDEIETLY